MKRIIAIALTTIALAAPASAGYCTKEMLVEAYRNVNHNGGHLKPADFAINEYKQDGGVIKAAWERDGTPREYRTHYPSFERDGYIEIGRKEFNRYNLAYNDRGKKKIITPDEIWEQPDKAVNFIASYLGVRCLKPGFVLRK